GTLQIGASEGVCNYIFPKMLKRFFDQYPKVKIDLFSGNSEAVARDLVDFKVEEGFFHRVPKERSLEIKNLGFIPFCVAYSPKNELLQKRQRSNLELLSKIPYIGPRLADYA